MEDLVVSLGNRCKALRMAQEKAEKASIQESEH